MTEIDPGWFYSTLSQTSAAIVGLMGAVLGSRILEHLALMREERRELVQRIQSTYDHLKGRIAHWKAFRNFLTHELSEDEKALEHGETRRETYPDLPWEGKPPGQKVEMEVGKHRSLLEQNLQVVEKIIPEYTLFSGEIDDAQIVSYASKLRDLSERLRENTLASHMVEVDAGQMEKLANRISRFRIKLYRRSFVMVFLVLAWLSVTGILWPLSFLPGLPGDHSKLTMLVALGLGLACLIGYFGYQLRELHRLNRLYWTKRP